MNMMRGGNRQMRRMMDKMGLDMEEIPNVQEVIIKTDKKEIIIPKPSVTEMKSKENSIFQVIAESFEEKEVDAVFLDLKEPWLLLQPAWEALKPGHPLGILVPTTNQISQCLKEMKRLPFVGVEVVELLLRKYKTNPDRIRPEDRMVAHTGYLIFARKVEER